MSVKSLYIASLFLLFSPAFSYAQEKDLMFTGDFTFAYSDQVKIKAGGAVANKNRKEMQSGTRVGDVSIDPVVYKKMESEAGTRFRIEIKKSGSGNYREVTLINLQKKQSIKGLYDITTREMLFATAKGKKSGNECGSIGMGVVKGRLSSDMKKIESGEFAIGFIAGCNPVLVGASVTFYYKGTLENTLTANASKLKDGDESEKKTETGTLWAAVDDTVWILDRLLSCRWRPVEWIHNGTKTQAKPEDFGHFYSNGLYECALLGMFDKGTWTYNGKLNCINLKLTNSTVTYFIDDITDTTLHCTSFNDEFVLKKYEYKPAGPVIDQSSNRTVLLCKGWTVDTHKKGILPITHKANDFIRFSRNGRYEQVVMNIYKTGTWHFIDKDSKISVSCGGVSVWEIKSLSDSEANLARPNETLVLRKK